MSANPEAQPIIMRLGYSPETRLVILHADDVGMCHAETQSFIETTAAGLVRCGSIMAPCPWVPYIARVAGENPAMDLGAHITLNAEWREYRWGAISTRDPAGGLLDGQGCLWRSTEETHRHMDPEAAIIEIRAQVESLLSLGIDLTHIDTHMGTVFHPALLSAYIELGLSYRLPVMVPRSLPEMMAQHGMPEEVIAQVRPAYDRLVAAGYPLIDRVVACSGGAEKRLEQYIRILEELPPGITHLLFHAATPGPEIEAITTGWAERVADHRVFTDPALREYIDSRSDLVIIGYRDLRDALRAM